MNKINIIKQQQDLVASIKHELAKKNEFYKPSSFWHSVWFDPSVGRFLFADQYTRYEVVEPLIENKTLIFKGIESHQGEKMLRYVLSGVSDQSRFNKGDIIICWLKGAGYGDKYTVLEDTGALTLLCHKTGELCIVNNRDDYDLA